MVSITPDHIQRVKNAANLRSVVESYGIKLRPNGADTLVAPCCFHREKTASLKVHPKAGYYHCFGCHAKGDVLKFVQEIDGLSFPAAVKQLADQYGIPLDGRKIDRATQVQNEKYRREIVAESDWWFAAARMSYVREQNTILDIERRATAFLAERLDAEDSPGLEYAWFWVSHADRFYQRAADKIAWLDSLPSAVVAEAYKKVRMRYQAKYKAWAARGWVEMGMEKVAA